MFNKYIKKIKKFGAAKTAARIFGDIAYTVLHPLQKGIVFRKKLNPDRILFTSVPAYSDNAKVFFEYLEKTHGGGKAKFIWLIGRDDEMPEIPYPNVQIVRKGSLYHRGLSYPAFKAVYSSRYVFFTHRSPVQECGIRQGQTVVNLWHGCGYKDKEETGEKWITMNPCQLALVPGKVFIDTKTKFWGCDRSIVQPIGYPRYDLLKRESAKAKEMADSIRGGAKKLVVWMPTFRKSDRADYPEAAIAGKYDLPLLSSEEQLRQLNDFCAEQDIMLCVKRHPLQTRYSCEDIFLSNIRFISNETFVAGKVDLYSFLRYTDALVSDYSSISIDYLLLDRPIAFALEDFAAYKEARGFVFADPLQYMPGHHLYRFEDFTGFLRDVAAGNDPHKNARTAIMQDVHNPCENYCERLWNAVLQMKKKS